VIPGLFTPTGRPAKLDKKNNKLLDCRKSIWIVWAGLAPALFMPGCIIHMQGRILSGKHNLFKGECRISNKKFRTAEVKEDTSKFDIPCSTFCGSFLK
jgi:hypothetical protein